MLFYLFSTSDPTILERILHGRNTLQHCKSNTKYNATQKKSKIKESITNKSNNNPAFDNNLSDP